MLLFIPSPSSALDIYIYIYTHTAKEGNMKRVLPPSAKTQQALSSNPSQQSYFSFTIYTLSFSFVHHKIYTQDRTRLFAGPRRILNEKARLNKTPDNHNGALSLSLSVPFAVVFLPLPSARSTTTTTIIIIAVKGTLDDERFHPARPHETHLTRAGLGRREDNYIIILNIRRTTSAGTYIQHSAHARTSTYPAAASRH